MKKSSFRCEKMSYYFVNNIAFTRSLYSVNKQWNNCFVSESLPLVFTSIIFLASGW